MEHVGQPIIPDQEGARVQQMVVLGMQRHLEVLVDEELSTLCNQLRLGKVVGVGVASPERDHRSQEKRCGEQDDEASSVGVSGA